MWFCMVFLINFWIFYSNDKKTELFGVQRSHQSLTATCNKMNENNGKQRSICAWWFCVWHDTGAAQQHWGLTWDVVEYKKQELCWEEVLWQKVQFWIMTVKHGSDQLTIISITMFFYKTRNQVNACFSALSAMFVTRKAYSLFHCIWINSDCKHLHAKIDLRNLSCTFIRG
jgi:hypothetical protein